MPGARHNRTHILPQARCFVCGQDNPAGLRLLFRADPDGDAAAIWTPGPELEGFRGIVHGGVVAAVLDEAMSKAVLFSGIEALTAELRVRYRHTVRPGMVLHVRGWIVSRSGRLSGTESSIADIDGVECAHAWARFLSPRVMRAQSG